MKRRNDSIGDPLRGEGALIEHVGCLKAWKRYFYTSIYLVTCYDVSLGHLRRLDAVFNAVRGGFHNFQAIFCHHNTAT